MSKKQAIKLYKYLDSNKYSKTLNEILEALDIKSSTFYNAINILREELLVTIYEPPKGYLLDDKSRNKNIGGEFSQNELTSLLIAYDLLQTLISNDFYTDKLQNIKQKITSLLTTSKNKHIDFIEVFQTGNRKTSTTNLTNIFSCLDNNLQFKAIYQPRTKPLKQKARIISPQRLVLYKNNWYLMAWCHQSNNIRSFAVEKFQEIQQTNKIIKKISKKQISDNYKKTYGIISGEKTDTAILLFDSKVSQWINDEIWHPNQKLTKLENSTTQLEVPINKNHTQEIELDIMKYGDGVKVIEPNYLKEKIKTAHKNAYKQYCL